MFGPPKYILILVPGPFGNLKTIYYTINIGTPQNSIGNCSGPYIIRLLGTFGNPKHQTVAAAPRQRRRASGSMTGPVQGGRKTLEARYGLGTRV